MSSKIKITLTQALPWLLIICGTIGLLMSGIIMFDKIKLIEDPAFVPGCDLNPVVACGSVMESWQSTAFWEIPNPFIGLAAFPVVITTGVVMLAGVRLPRWYWLGMLGGTIFGVLFIHWLAFQSIYNIQSLCPYCMGVWVVTIASFWYVFLYNLRQKYIKLPEKLSTFLQKHHLDILLLWYIAIIAVILNHFWYYYGPLLGF
jgi:uncharacterized membrane protein